MHQPRRPRPAPTVGVLIITSALLAACSNPSEDVRIGLCKDIVAVQLGTSSAINWTDVRTDTPGYRDARIKLRWSSSDGSGDATCSYPYNAVEDTAQHLSQPLTAYATSPSKVTINGSSLTGQALAQAVARAMQRQGKQLLDSAGQALQMNQ